MTHQLELDFSLPAEPGTYRQCAVVFTALAGTSEGEEAYYASDDLEWLHQQANALRETAVQLGRHPDARVMMRTVQCGPWEPVSMTWSGPAASAEMT